jgi:hypothetical protein
MSFIENLFGKRYLEWEEYMETIDNSDWNQVCSRIKGENQERRREIFKKMNFSG